MGKGKVLTILAAGLITSATVFAASSDKDRAQSGFLGVYLGEGAAVIGTIDDTAADGRLVAGDKIFSIDGEEVVDTSDLIEIISATEPGDVVVVEFQRGDDMLTEKIELGERKAGKQRNMWINKMGSGNPHLNFHVIGEDDEQNQFFFKMHGKNHGFFMSGGENEEVLELLKEYEGSKDLNVSVDCENGEGTVTIEADGQTSTHEIDCQDRPHGMVYSYAPHAFDMDVHQWVDKNIDLHELKDKLKGMQFEFKAPHFDVDWNALKGHHGHAIQLHRLHQHGEGAHFTVNPDGSIEAIVHKDGNSLTEIYKDANDLEARDLELFQKYQDLQDSKYD